MRRDRRKDLYRRERDSLEGPHEEAEIQRKALRHGKNLAFSKDTCLKKERVPSKVTPRKIGVGLKRRREPSKREVQHPFRLNPNGVGDRTTTLRRLLIGAEPFVWKSFIGPNF